MEQIFQRAELLLGTDEMAIFRQTRVIIFGVGGVGSWCAEALVRTGFGHLTIVDSDVVCPSNINRQLMATTLTVGVPKVACLRERLLTINPDADIVAVQTVYSEQTADAFDLSSYDYVIDAIDSLKDKLLLIQRATDSTATFFSSMGAALKTDPSRIRVGEFWKVEGCPLARALRLRFKHLRQRPARKFLCVFSDEHQENRGQQPADEPKHVNGSLVHITAVFGFTLASLVINDRNKSVGNNPIPS